MSNIQALLPSFGYVGVCLCMDRVVFDMTCTFRSVMCVWVYLYRVEDLFNFDNCKSYS